MFAIRAIDFGSLWSLFTWTSQNQPGSPVQPAARLVDIQEYETAHPQQYIKHSIPSRRSASTPIPSDCGSARPPSTPRRRPSIQRLKSLVTRLKQTPSAQNNGSDAGFSPNYRNCTLCQTEIDEDLKYVTKAKIIQFDGTYISTRCCHHFVHSSCYRITLQYFIDSKGRPRCPICRNYPDLFVACWALGYVFDKDVGDIDDDECYCPPGVVCEVCEGRKQLLEDLQASRISQDREDDSLLERLWTIDEVEEDEDEVADG